MTTTTSRRNTQSFTSERQATNDARQAGAVERGELASYIEAVKARAIELWLAGYRNEAREFVKKHLGSH